MMEWQEFSSDPAGIRIDLSDRRSISKMREIIARAQELPGPGEYEVDIESLLARQRRLADRSAALLSSYCVTRAFSSLEPYWCHDKAGTYALALPSDLPDPLPLVSQGVCSHNAQKQEASRSQSDKSWGEHNQRNTSRIQVCSYPDLSTPPV